jgi:hypothetical protein
VRRSIKAGLAGATTLALTAGGVFLAATPAMAADEDVTTPGWYYYDVSDNAVNINDVEAYYSNFLGSGAAVYGTGDAFDTFLSTISITDGDLDIDLAWTPVTSDWVDNGVSTLIASASADFGDGNSIDVIGTLRVQNGHAQWSYAFDTDIADLSGYSVIIDGDLGSDTPTTVISVAANTYVSHDEYRFDPIIGFNITGGTGYTFEIDGDGEVEAAFPVAPITIAAALVDYDPCSQQAAIDRMTALAPTLLTSFGSTIEPIFSTTCITAAAAAKLDRGIATDQTLPVTYSDALAEYYFGEDLWELDPEDIADLRFVPVSGVPAGVTITPVFDTATFTWSLQVSGTPTQTGSFTARIAVYYADGGDEGDNYIPLILDVPLEVAGPVLASTGVSQSPALWIGGVIVLALGAGLVVFRSSSRRAQR